MSNNKLKDIIDISTVDSFYQGDQLRLYAIVGEEAIEAFFTDVDQLYEFAPIIGFSQKDIASWFLNEAHNSTPGSLIQKWFMAKARRWQQVSSN